ncbi:MAG: hypothetical protein OXB84_08835 [Halobacteriovoraceae bacterium]|nr:hypothetical protein [Halobacteriovoraceae bacterium]
MRKIFLKLILFAGLILFYGCQGHSSRGMQDSMNEAHFLLNSRNCTGAMEILEEHYTNANADYLQVYATAFACFANFSTTRFFSDELTNLDFSNAGFFRSLAAMDTSGDMTSPTDTDYTNLQRAIDELLYAGGIDNPSTADRISVFGNETAINLNLQNFYMIMVQMGRWIAYYGNADATGAKGGGASGNSCIMDYNNATVMATIDNPPGSTGSCTTTNDGHPDLIASRERQCQGIVLFNNLIEIANSLNVLGSINSDLDNLTTFTNTLSNLCGLLPGGAAICDVRHQIQCEMDPAITDDIIEEFYGGIIERLYI